ncbi:MAG: alpha/beta hydrolase [archaeon]
MKNAIILHGTGSTPESFWQPSIKTFLESKGYTVWIPELPQKDDPDVTIQLPFILENGTFTEETIIIGHSAGVPLALSVLEHISVRIKRAILVAGYARIDKKKPKPEKILPAKFNWRKIKKHCVDIIFVHSDNDPWGCDDKEGRFMFRHCGGKFIVLHGEGHMGSDQFKQPYPEFPLLEKLLELP